MVPRLGQFLVESGLLSDEQVRQVLEEQQRSGRPFGVIAEALYGVSPDDIEDAWAQQYAQLTRSVKPEVEAFDHHAVDLVTRRQAWQFRVLPIRFEDGELIIATTREHLRRALRFATNVIGVPVFLVITEADALGEALCRHYPMPGMGVDSVDDHALDHFLQKLHPAA